MLQNPSITFGIRFSSLLIWSKSFYLLHTGNYFPPHHQWDEKNKRSPKSVHSCPQNIRFLAYFSLRHAHGIPNRALERNFMFVVRCGCTFGQGGKFGKFSFCQSGESPVTWLKQPLLHTVLIYEKQTVRWTVCPRHCCSQGEPTCDPL